MKSIYSNLTKIASFILVLFVFPFQEVNAQNTFKDGSIFTLNNDTIFGKIEYRKINRYNVCRFLYNDSITTFTSSEIRGFGFSNKELFISGISCNSFVKLLADGEIRLFKNDTLFIQKSGDQVFKLEKRYTYVVEGGVRYKREDTRWRGVLRFLLSDSDIKQDRINKMIFDEQEITKLVNEYNKKKNPDIIPVNINTYHPKISYGIFAGINYSSLKCDANILKIDYSYLKERYDAINLSFGFSQTITLPAFSEKVAFHSEIFFIQSRFSGIKIEENIYDKYNYYTSIRFNSIVIPMGFRYTLIGRTNSLFILGGFSYYLNFNPDITYTIEREYNNIVTTEEGIAFHLATHQLGYWYGIEFQKPCNKYVVGASIKYNNGLNLDYLDSALSTDISRLAFSLFLIK